MLSLRQCTATEAVRARDVGLCLQTVNATPLTGGLKGAKAKIVLGGSRVKQGQRKTGLVGG